ncbi:putative 26S proteasome regulatory subunit [Entomortierella beljakovae]|nr:putative 26S proteasome regulatory subunit [Entomortierella beljakovae]
MVNAQSELMTQAQALMKQKDEIEGDIKKAQEELQSQNVGMTESLVDKESFPRSDIDLVVVTTARSNIVRLKNDLKVIMQKIEEILHAIHAQAIAEREQEEASGSSSTSTTQHQTIENTALTPFARVNAIAPDSPAKEAGLLQGDMVVVFGIIDVRTPDVLPSLSQHVQLKEDKPIVVKVQRNESTELHSLVLVPRQGWGGRGLLGCHIVPV